MEAMRVTFAFQARATMRPRRLTVRIDMIVSPLVFLVAWLSVGAQTSPQTPSSLPANTQSVRVRGCLDGRSIRDSDGSIGKIGATYRLTGSKSILAALKEHNHHDDEIAGTMTIADEKSYKVGKEKTVGKTRIYGGASSSDDTGGFEKVEDPTIEVAAIRHLDRPCPK